MLVLLSACGGGGGGGASSSSLPNLSSPVAPGEPSKEPALVAFAAQTASVVNTTTDGDQVLRSTGNVGNGYTVTWLSKGEKLFLQRYTATASKLDGEAAIELCIACISDLQATLAIANSGLAVQRDGSVTVAYSITRPLNPAQPNDQTVKAGVYFQRFNPQGARITNETEVVSRTFIPGSRSPSYGQIKVVPLATGGFAVGWADVVPSSVNIRTTFAARLFESQGQAASGPVVVGAPGSPGDASYTLHADKRGGFAATALQLDESFEPLASVTYVDPMQSVKTIALPAGTRDALLLPLSDGRFVLFGQQSGGAYRQFLNSLGNADGAAVAIASLPLAASETANAGFAVLWQAGSAMTFRQFASNGQPTSESVAVDTGGNVPQLLVLGPDIALTWTAGTSTGQDVLTQLFVASVR